MSAPVNRRHFLAAGAVLAAGGLVLPRNASAERVGLIATPETSTDLAAQIRAILDRPNLSYYDKSFAEEFNCQCARCRALRRREWECLECGYVGPWLVSRCECRQIRADNIKYAREHIAAIEAGREKPRPGDYTLADHYQNLREEEARPDVMCLAAPDRATQSRRRENGQRHCGHGTLWCPTCGNDGESGSRMDTPEHLLAVLRELRALLGRANV